MQYLPVTWMFAPYLKEKLYYNIIRNEEDILVKFVKAMYETARFQRDDFDNRRRDAGAPDDNIGNSGNSGANGNGGGHSGAVVHGPNGNEGARGPVGGGEWVNHLGTIRRNLGYKSHDKNAAKP